MADGKACADVDECVETPYVCSQLCENVTDLITAHAETDTLENQTENHVDRFLESSHICFSVTGEYKASISFNRLFAFWLKHHQKCDCFKQAIPKSCPPTRFNHTFNYVFSHCLI